MDRTALADVVLDAKAFSQPLGSENAWNDLGEGRFELSNHIIRVVAYEGSLATPMVNSPMKVETDGADDNALDDDPKPPSSHGALRSPTVVLEDLITNDTPFVAKDGCLVWNSPDQSLSLCVMFSSEIGFQASWSALLSMQQNPYPPVDYDVFLPRASSPSIDDTSRPSTSEENDAAIRLTTADSEESQLERMRAILNPATLCRFSYVERHCIACTIVEKDYGKNPNLFADVSMCVSLLKLSHTDLLEYLATDEVYSRYVTGMDYQGPMPQSWVCPEGLTPQTSLGQVINTALRIHHLKNEVLPLSSDDEVTAIVDTLLHRLQNEIVCALIADEELISESVAVLKKPRSIAIEGESSGSFAARRNDEEEAVSVRLKFLTNLFALTTSAFAKELVPHVITKVFSAGLVPALADVCTNYLSAVPPIPSTPDTVLGETTLPLPTSATLGSLGSLTGSIGRPPSNLGDTVGSLSGTGRERPSSTTSRDGDTILEPHAPSKSPIEQVASAPVSPREIDGSAAGKRSKKDRRLHSRGSSSSSTNDARGLRSSQSGRLKSPSEPRFVMASTVEQDLARLLEETVNRLNERGEERTLSEVFRVAIINEPDRYDAFMSFLLRMQSTSVPMTLNRMLLFHLLGLHDDEGNNCDRKADVDAVATTDAFQSFFISRVLPGALRSSAVSAHRSRRTAQRDPTLLGPGLLRVLEYLYHNGTTDIRCKLSKTLFAGSQSTIVRFLLKDLSSILPSDDGDVCPATVPRAYSRPSSVSSTFDPKLRLSAPLKKDNLLTNLRFIKAALSDEDPIAVKALCVENDVVHPFLVLRKYHRHLNSMLHSTILSLLQMILTKDHLRSIRDLILLRHRNLLPASFCEWCDREALTILEMKLKGSSQEELDTALRGLSRSATPNAAMIIDSSGSGNRIRSVDEGLPSPVHTTMEEVNNFPSKLRSAIGSLSPTPGSRQSPSPTMDPVIDGPVSYSSSSSKTSPESAESTSSGESTNCTFVGDEPMKIVNPKKSPMEDSLPAVSHVVNKPVPPKKKPHAPPLPRRAGSGGRRKSTGDSRVPLR